MALTGHVQNGVVVFDQPLRVHDGTVARVDLLTPNQTHGVRSLNKADNGRGGASSLLTSISCRMTSRKRLE